MKKYVLRCPNCGVDIVIDRVSVHTEKYTTKTGEELIINYVKCKTCEEKILKQIDTKKTWEELTPQILKLHKRGRMNKLSKKQTDRLRSMEQVVNKTRRSLEDRYFNEIYQFINQETGTADQELDLGV